MIPLIQCNICTSGITFLAHPVYLDYGGTFTTTLLQYLLLNILVNIDRHLAKVWTSVQ